MAVAFQPREDGTAKEMRCGWVVISERAQSFPHYNTRGREKKNKLTFTVFTRRCLML